MTALEKYLAAFKKLRRASNNGGAPHKPVLLFAVLEGVARGEIGSNRIFITPELILCFKEYWSKLVFTQHQINFTLPFFHMRTEGFWRLKCWPEKEIPLTKSSSIKSFKALVETVMYAEIDEELFKCMSDPVCNQILKDELLRLYFPGANNFILQNEELHQRTEALLQLDRARYKEQLEKIVRGKTEEAIQEEYFVRGALFKREVPRQYDYTCAITRLRILSFENIQMVDACHIVPFSVSQDDTIKNGICLSPTLHRAFDRGLITITEDYKVKVSPAVRETPSSAALGQFNSLPILTPPHPAYRPSKENLLWHGREVFVGGA